MPKRSKDGGGVGGYANGGAVVAQESTLDHSSLVDNKTPCTQALTAFGESFAFLHTFAFFCVSIVMLTLTERGADERFGSTCAQCQEWQIPAVISDLKCSRIHPKFANLRLLWKFLDQRGIAVSGCNSCSWLCWNDSQSHGLRIKATELQGQGLTRTEAQELQSRLWFQLHRGELVRSTGILESRKGSHGSFHHYESDERSREITLTPGSSYTIRLTQEKFIGTQVDFKSINDLLALCEEYHPNCQPWEPRDRSAPSADFEIAEESSRILRRSVVDLRYRSLQQRNYTNADVLHQAKMNKYRHKRANKLFHITLIDVQSMSLVQYASIKQPFEYIALSYVWGNTKSCAPDSNKLPRQIPKTISDSMEVVRRLGKRYLWADALCIDHSDEKSRIFQISIMDAIYAGAYATIVALDGISADSGLPGVCKTSNRAPQLLARFGETMMLEKTPPLNDLLLESVWATRGWTYQEGLLSNRCIIFARDRVYFSCNTMQCTECTQPEPGTYFPEKAFLSMRQMRCKTILEDLPIYGNCLTNPLRDRNLTGISDSSKLRIYSHIINNYINRELSRDRDSLNAISALLKQMQHTMLTDGFLFGLPLGHFRSSLLWKQANNRARKLHGDRYKMTRRVNTRVPSWSWAGWRFSSDICLFDLAPSPIHPYLKIRTTDGRIAHMDRSAADSERWKSCSVAYTGATPQEKNNIRQAILSTQLCYEALASEKVERAPNLMLDITSNELFVDGIILQLPCFDKAQERFTEGEPPIYCDKATCDEDWNHFLTIYWGSDEEELQSIKATSPSRSSQDLLFVAAEFTGGDLLALRFLHLYWNEDKIATRGGVVDVVVHSQYVARFWQLCSAKRCQFRFK